MARYNNIFKVDAATDNIPALGIIPELESDVYLMYNSADRLDLISYRVYGDSQYWWVILGANEYQIEFDIDPGEILRIPYPLSDALAAIRKNINES